ncbi:MAG: DNA cytosine methyltransferase [Clostridiales bacterium]|nr:DNA cytosine methyltransferase [Clostridiales bacterium]
MECKMRYYRDNFLNELIVDNFAGGGGASVGIELAVGRPVDIAVNHDADAIALHKVNHPYTEHYQEDVFAIDPEKVTGGRPVGIMWASPDCKHHSKAKGGKPVEKKIRGLSWVILKWAMSRIAPRCVFMENVEEIQTWGPLIDRDGKMYPDPERKGETFNGFVAMLTNGIEKTHPAFAEACEFLKIDQQSAEGDRLASGLGYAVDYRVLKACDYGAPTIRKRFYLVARRDGQPIVFPKPTHGAGKGLKPYRTAAECIDWSLPCPSIFGRKKDLATNTQRRIARGLDKFVIKNPRPFIMEMNYQNTAQDPEKPMTTQTTANHHYLITPTLIQYHSEQGKGEVRGQKTDEPIMTVDGSPRYGINACYLSKYFGGEKQSGADAGNPMPTVTGIDHNAAVVVHLSSRYGDGKDGRGSEVNKPAPTVTGTNHSHVVAANIVHYYGGADHASKTDAPLPTVTTLPHHYLTESHLCVLRRNTDCKRVDEPLATLTTSAGHFAQVVTYIQKLNSMQEIQNWDKVRELLNTYAGYNIAADEILILEINGIQHFIADIGMRMLKAKELKLAQGFPIDYVIDIEPYIGKKYSEAKQIARLGNAVCPPVATALIRANCADMAYKKPLHTVAELNVAMEG